MGHIIPHSRRGRASFSGFWFPSKPPENFITLFLIKNKKKTPHLLRPENVPPPGALSVAVKQFKRRAGFRLLGHILQLLVDVGALFTFFPPKKTRGLRSFQTKQFIRRSLGSGPLQSFRANSTKPQEKMTTLKGDYCLRVILLRLSSMLGQFSVQNLFRNHSKSI